MHRLLKNKYKLLLGFLIFFAGIDIANNNGQFRLLFSKNFNVTQISNQTKANDLSLASKHFAKAVNSVERYNAVSAQDISLELDVWFDRDLNDFKVTHNIEDWQGTLLSGFMDTIFLKKNSSNKHVFYFDLKNLDTSNAPYCLKVIDSLRAKYDLNKKIIVESTNATALSLFYDYNYFTVYYTPFLNPYKASLREQNLYLATVKKAIEVNKICGISGYYFQIPLLQQAFKDVAFFQWQGYKPYSLVSRLYRQKVLNDNTITGVMYE
jgi:hypothetical protein